MDTAKILKSKNRIFSPGFFGSIFTGSSNWVVLLEDKTFDFVDSGQTKVKIAYEAIETISVIPGAVWSEVVIASPKNKCKFDGISNSDARILARELTQEVEKSLVRSIEPHLKTISAISRSIKMLLEKPRYLANRDMLSWIERMEIKYGEGATTVINAASNPIFPHHTLKNNLKAQIELMADILIEDSQIIAKRNEKFVNAEIVANKAFFDTVEKTPLTEEQRRACVVMEDRNLLIAAAGSGKTSSVVGKLGYALQRNYVTPEQILVLAFNNHAAEELEERINDRLNDILGGKTIKVKTFHALGLEIIAEVENIKPTVPDYVSDKTGGGNLLISQLINELLETNRDFLQNWILFRTVYFKPTKDPASFTSIDEWEQYVKATGDYENKKSGYRTMHGELVKSGGELAIANWLFMNSVEYQYERAYEFDTADKQHRQYHPDFYFPEIKCYLEHYALDASGNPPPAFGEKYYLSMLWKKALHLEKGTDVFETYYSEYIGDTLFGKLENELTIVDPDFQTID